MELGFAAEPIPHASRGQRKLPKFARVSANPTAVVGHWNGTSWNVFR